MTTSLARVPVPPGPRGVAAVTRAARALLDGTGPAFWASPAAEIDAWSDSQAVPDGVGVVLATSGSTGAPLPVLIGADALLSAATAGARALGPPGHWLTAVPVTGAGGLLTVVRALLSGAEPIAWPGVGGAGSFTAASFAEAGEEVLRRADSDGVPAYVSFVPTQLTRILRSRPATDVVGGFARVLVGGAALTPGLRDRAERAGVRLVGTYGATETCGGVVYDGHRLSGVTVDLDSDGQVLVGGTTVARGYLHRPDLTAERFADGVFHTRDLGTLTDGVLYVLGRADQHVKVGGVLVSLTAIAEELRTDSRVLDVAVVGVADDEWGHRPRAYVVPATGTAAEVLADDLSSLVVERLGPPARPRSVDLVAELPTTRAGKPVVRGER